MKCGLFFGKIKPIFTGNIRVAGDSLAHEVALREDIEQMIFFIRGHRVMMDRDLAVLYEELVTNWHRFKTLKHSSSSPYAFTENGVAMLAKHRRLQ